jgi:NADH:ubiquinone oxidoreductase subunit K
MLPIQNFLYLGALLFCVGLAVIMIKRNTIMMLLGIELMLNASNVNLVAFNQLYPASLDGQMFALFVIIVAVCEAAVGLAIILRVYQYYQTSIPDEISELKD